MNIEKSKSAVVLIEFQNQWTGKGFDSFSYSFQLNSETEFSNSR